MSFGLAGTLTPGLAVGEVVVACRVVDDAGRPLWVGEPVGPLRARSVVACGAPRAVDDPAERASLAARTGAEIVDMETVVLAASGRLVGVVRVVSDTPGEQLGRLRQAATSRGDVDWSALAVAFLREPIRSARAAARARRALRSLDEAAAWLGRRVRETSIR